MLAAALAKTPTTDDLVAELLAHVGRYRLTVPDALQTSSSFASLQMHRTRRLVRHCLEQRLIAAASLHQGQTYWHLDTGGAKRLGADHHAHGPLSETAKIKAYALLRFCCLSDQPRQRLARQQITNLLPEVHGPGLAGTYYFVSEGPGRLGLARIDAGRRGRWDRIIQTLREDVAAHLRRPAWRRLIEAGRFELAVITVFPQKAERLREALAQHRDLRSVSLAVIAMPELLPLVMSIRGKEVPAQ